ncbi:MAG: hypothetical protein JNJ83_09725 [Verrucomicrobiaceae bacterium]|nr:hypothetical protein [Verrucomicrobiaceae bacterium]
MQHELAMELRQMDRHLSIRLEVPFQLDGQRRYMDMIIRSADALAYVELKYKIRTARIVHNNEVFELRDQGAVDQGAYDILKDIQRIEGVVDGAKNAEGFVIVVSNDPRYWSAPVPRGKPYLDEAFKLTEGRVIGGKLGWHSSASAGSMKGRESDIRLRSSYRATWEEYALEPSHFRMLCFHVTLDSTNQFSSRQDEDDSVPPALTAEKPHQASSAPQVKRLPNWQRVLDALVALGGRASLDRVRTKFALDNPDRNPINVRHELVLMCVNHPKRIHYGQAQKPRLTNTGHPVDKVFMRQDGDFELYDPGHHGVWEIFLNRDGKPDIRQV